MEHLWRSKGFRILCEGPLFIENSKCDSCHNGTMPLYPACTLPHSSGRERKYKEKLFLFLFTFFTHTQTHTYIYIYTQICVYMYIFIYIYVCIYVYIQWLYSNTNGESFCSLKKNHQNASKSFDFFFQKSHHD